MKYEHLRMMTNLKQKQIFKTIFQCALTQDNMTCKYHIQHRMNRIIAFSIPIQQFWSIWHEQFAPE
jgi:hypothetical protein